MNDTDMLIDDLAGSLRPVRAIPVSAARAGLCGLGALTIVLALAKLGMRRDLSAFEPEALTLLSSGLFLLVGIACGLAATRMARPAVGAANDGWRWAVAAMLLLPAVAIGQALLFPELRLGMAVSDGIACLGRGSLAGLATAGLLTAWLRRGAPVRVELASWLVGLSAGSVGAVAIGLSCPAESLSHIGLWHSAIIVINGAIGRLVLPRVLRW